MFCSFTYPIFTVDKISLLKTRFGERSKLLNSMKFMRLILRDTLFLAPLPVKNDKLDTHAKFISDVLSIELGP